MTPAGHWTSDSTKDFVFQISSDFIGQIETRLEESGEDYIELANRIGVSPSRVSQVLNNPGNMTLESTVRYARALGMKIALVAYDDGDPTNDKGPINAQVFTQCWERLGSPEDLSESAEYAACSSSVSPYAYLNVAGPTFGMFPSIQPVMFPAIQPVNSVYWEDIRRLMHLDDSEYPIANQKGTLSQETLYAGYAKNQEMTGRAA